MVCINIERQTVCTAFCTQYVTCCMYIVHCDKIQKLTSPTAVQPCSHSPRKMRIVTHFQHRDDKPDASLEEADLKIAKNI